MPVIAIVGAGPGLGLSVARAFGRRDHRVALISRGQANLGRLVEQLTAEGIDAAGFPADVTDHDGLTSALERAAQLLGTVTVLEYSPYPGLTPVTPAELTIDTLAPEIGSILYGAVSATRAVLPGMLAAGSGTLLYTIGGGAINPYPMLAAVNTAQAGLRNWVHNLHNTLGERGVYAATIAINVFIGAQSPAPGIPHLDPDTIAQAYWRMHTQRTKAEHLIKAPPPRT